MADTMLQSVWVRGLAHRLLEIIAADPDTRIEADDDRGHGEIGQAAANLIHYADLLEPREVGPRGLLSRIDGDEHLRQRAVQEAITNALASTWARRADMLDWAAERPGDHPGGPVDWETGEPLAPPAADPQRSRDLHAAAMACRQKAELLEAGWLNE